MANGNYILCIDDDKDDCALLSEAIYSIDPSIILCFENNGKSALQFLKEASAKNDLPGLIILDLNMPGMDGKETLNGINAIPELTDTPIVIFTTSISDTELLGFEKKGVSTFVKPHTIEGYKMIAKTIVYSII
jgi:CheY-like chemotaxis protein